MVAVRLGDHSSSSTSHSSAFPATTAMYADANARRNRYTYFTSFLTMFATSVVLQVAVEEIVLDGVLKVAQFSSFIPVIVFHMHLPEAG